ncbi:hypothetical protein COU19_03220 [Candidatus Kaiserbacteria bacterium CG10_big_fil_rev_8_21_14_0_10_56_12]|uniref:Uncharacterized protein n=1 Tax=Candidatus Kaiserbacteria bacterium CG10_big_fil_rev_8_21_14_0_10_56_12 TaxID=1974611 RepID=A0A2H0U987_9BACT|nr:MAG: hypothetical protein COU19_03220 [Candidatus Kaiserbacteria bacterium CG10_big_fil_rev_8_21_14_0_10_56_12]
MQTEQANVEYFFRLLYDLIFGAHGAGGDFYAVFFQHLWLWIIGVGYTLSAIGFFLIIFETVQLFELRQREEEYYSTLLVPPPAVPAGNTRWLHIQSLMGQTSPSAWREAITEADIMLDDILTDRGIEGANLGEKLKAADFLTLDDAWEAHKVRNQIAHQGSAFDLTETLAQRTIQRYQNVFREFRAI